MGNRTCAGSRFDGFSSKPTLPLLQRRSRQRTMGEKRDARSVFAQGTTRAGSTYRVACSFDPSRPAFARLCSMAVLSGGFHSIALARRRWLRMLGLRVGGGPASGSLPGLLGWPSPLASSWMVLVASRVKILFCSATNSFSASSCMAMSILRGLQQCQGVAGSVSSQ